MPPKIQQIVLKVIFPGSKKVKELPMNVEGETPDEAIEGIRFRMSQGVTFTEGEVVDVVSASEEPKEGEEASSGVNNA